MVNAGLVLEGGGLRGVYTAGVLDYFMDIGLQFNNIYGVSAGACHACSYISQQKYRAMRTSIEYLGNPRYASLRSYLLTGDYFGVKMVYDEIPNTLIPFDYEAFASSPSTLYAVLTNCLTGKAEYWPVRALRQDMVLIQASSSLPLLSNMVKIAGIPYLDGGIADSIPIKHSVLDGNKKNVVILTQSKEYSKSPDRMLPAMQFKYRHYKELVKSMRNRHINYNASLQFLRGRQKAGAAFVIQPRCPVKIGRLEKNKKKLMNLYQQGYYDAKASRERLEKFLYE